MSGLSGNITVNGTLTFGAGDAGTVSAASRQYTLVKRGLGAANESNVDLSAPPYAIHNGMPAAYSS